MFKKVRDVYMNKAFRYMHRGSRVAFRLPSKTQKKINFHSSTKGNDAYSIMIPPYQLFSGRNVSFSARLNCSARQTTRVIGRSMTTGTTGDFSKQNMIKAILKILRGEYGHISHYLENLVCKMPKKELKFLNRNLNHEDRLDIIELSINIFEEKEKKINNLRQSIYKVIGSLYDYLVEDNDRLSKNIHKLTHKELIEVKHAFESNNEGKKRAITQQLSGYGLDPNNLYEVTKVEVFDPELSSNNDCKIAFCSSSHYTDEDKKEAASAIIKIMRGTNDINMTSILWRMPVDQLVFLSGRLNIHKDNVMDQQSIINQTLQRYEEDEKKMKDLRGGIFKVMQDLYDDMIEDYNRLAINLNKLTLEQLILVFDEFDGDDEEKKHAIAQQLCCYGVDETNVYQVFELQSPPALCNGFDLTNSGQIEVSLIIAEKMLNELGLDNLFEQMIQYSNTDPDKFKKAMVVIQNLVTIKQFLTASVDTELTVSDRSTYNLNFQEFIIKCSELNNEPKDSFIEKGNLLILKIFSNHMIRSFVEHRFKNINNEIFWLNILNGFGIDNVCLLINKEKSVGNSLEKLKQAEIRIQNILDFHCLLILSSEKNIVGVDFESIEGSLSTLDDDFKALNNAKSFDEINDVAGELIIRLIECITIEDLLKAIYSYCGGMFLK